MDDHVSLNPRVKKMVTLCWDRRMFGLQNDDEKTSVLASK